MTPERPRLTEALRTLDEQIDQTRRLSQRRRLHAAVEASRPSLFARPSLLMGSCAAVAALTLAVMVTRDGPTGLPAEAPTAVATRSDHVEVARPTETIPSSTVEVPADPEPPRRVVLARGVSMILAKSTRARARRMSARKYEVALEDGQIELDLGKRVARRVSWVVLAAQYRVDAKSSEMSVSYDAASETLLIKVQKGVATVSGPGLKNRKVVAGEELLRSTAKAREARPSARASEQEVKDWRHLYAEGQYAAALSAAKRSGLTTNTESLSAQDLSDLADAARLARAPSEAHALLLSLRKRFPDMRNGREAAFLLGRLALDSERDRKSAEHWFSTYLKESPSGTYAQESLGRLLTIASQGSDEARARQLAEQYLSKYPGGPYAPVARSMAQ